MATTSLTTELLRFVQRAGVERDATRILSEMTRFIARAFDVHRVSLYVSEDGRLRTLVSEYASGETRPDLWTRYLEEGRLDDFPLAAVVAAARTPVLHRDPSIGFPPELVEVYEIHPYLAVPVDGQDGDLLGIVLIEGSPDVLQEQASELAELAGFVSLAVHNVRTLAQEERRARQAEALLEVTTVLTRTTNLTQVLASVSRESARATGFERASIFLIDDNGILVPTMSQFADGHSDPHAWEQFLTRSEEVPACRKAVETGEPYLVQDTEAVPAMVGNSWWGPFGLRSMLVVPLAAWGERFGAMVLDHREPRRIDDEQVRVAMAVASQGAAAIGLARLLASERAANERLAELDRLKTAFVATVSHELRTPLTSIVGFTQVLPELVDGEASEFVNLMARESLHLESLIANLLDTSRLEAGILDIRQDRVDVTRVAREAVDLVSHLHPEVVLDGRIDPAIEMFAGDAARLRQVFVNLLENACKYGGHQVRMAVSSDGAWVHIDVEDDGPGIPVEARQSVFDRFHRLHAGQESGTGIGLYLVKALVEAHGGEVGVTDGPRLGGAWFTVRIPCAATVLEHDGVVA